MLGANAPFFQTGPRRRDAEAYAEQRAAGASASRHGNGSVRFKMVGQKAPMPFKLTHRKKKEKKTDGPRKLLPCNPPHPPTLHSSPAVSHNAPALCVKSRRKKREGNPI